MRKVTAVLGNSQKLDGGAMFGNVPKTMWSQWVNVDNLNRITLQCRAMLVEDKNQRILFEAGIGAFFEPTLKERYGIVSAEHQLLASLAKLGLKDTDIDKVVLSHLHFDHAGGLLSAWKSSEEPKLLFPNATYIVSSKAWKRAQKPHARDKASFVPTLNQLLQRSNRLVEIKRADDPILGLGFHFHFSDGHTPSMMLTEVTMPGGNIIFGADLIPGTAWVHVPISMGYDRYPELLIDEKQKLLAHIVNTKARLFYTHDENIALSKITQDDKGRYKALDGLTDALVIALED